MTESTTRDFISQWPYDNGQDYDDVRDEPTIQWRSVDRIAEQMRQREESRLEENFATMDFEARAAALEAHFFQPSRHASGCKSPPVGTRLVTKVRPQSASHTPRAVENNGVSSSRARPQSAKARSEVLGNTNVPQRENCVAWKSVSHRNPSKWREILARGPEFEQLSLRRLELETYELLYNTLQEHQVVQTKQTSRRRKMKNSVTTTAKAQDCNPTLACGSGLHLARSRKRRQQEHDRQMMLGKSRESSRVNRTEDKRDIQDKPRTRSKLATKKKSQNQRPESQQTSQVFAQQTTSKLPRQSRTCSSRGPWIPSGLTSSLANREKSFEKQLSLEKRVAQVLDTFRSQADTHLRLSRSLQSQLKAQQSARDRRPRKTDLTLENSTAARPNARPKSANATISRQISNRSISPDGQLHRNCSDEKMKETGTIEKKTPRPTQSPDHGNETLLSESPATLTLVIPPLKLPPHPWEVHESDGATADLSPIHNVMVQAFDEPTAQSSELGVAGEDDPELFVGSRASANAATVEGLNTSREMQHEDELRADSDSMAAASSESQVANDSDTDEPTCIDRISDVSPSGAINEENSNERHKGESTKQQYFVEDEYRAESLIEHASTRPSPGDTEPSPTTLGYESLEKESLGSDRSTLSGFGMDFLIDNDTVHVETKASNDENVGANEERIFEEDWGSPPLETSTGLPVDGDALDLSKTTRGLDNPEGGYSVASAESKTNYGEESVNVMDVVNGNPCSKNEEVVKLGDRTNSVDLSDNEAEMSLHDRNVLGDSECDLSGNGFNEPVILVDDTDAFLSAVEENVCGAMTSTSHEEILSGEGEGTISSDLLFDSKEDGSAQGRGNSSSTAVSEHQYDHSTVALLDVPLLADSNTILLDRFRSLESGEILPLLTDLCSRAEDTVLTSNEATDSIDRSDSGANAQPSENDRQYSKSGTGVEQRELEFESTVSSNLLNLAMETLTSAATAQLTAAPTEKHHESEHATVNSSPKKNRSSKLKSPSSEKTKSTLTSDSEANASETPIATSLPARNSSPRSKVGSGDQPDEWLHQQALTRSFLQRVSSCKIVEENCLNVPCQEQVDPGDQLTTASVSTSVDADVEQKEKAVKERENIDGDVVSILKRECSKALNDFESTAEKYPQVLQVLTSNLGTTSPTKKTTSFTSVDDGSTSTSAMDTCTEAKPEQIDPLDLVGQAQGKEEPNAFNTSTGGNQKDSMQESSQLALANADIRAHPTSVDATENVDQNPTQPWSGHHNAARKIQSQYRCFVRRQLILDQLRFMVAKKRRQTRRKTRQKVKKSEAVDTVVSASTDEAESSVTAVAVDLDVVDNMLEEVQRVVPSSVETTSEHLSSERPEPLTEAGRVGVRKGSSEYAFDLFEVNGDMLETAPLLEQDVINSSDDSTSSGLPQVEKSVSYQQSTLQSRETSVDGPSIVELAATPTDAIIDEADSEVETMQPRWDRYVNSTTSRSFYYNPVTNETQWTAPDKDRDHAAINSPGVAAVTATEAVVLSSGPTGINTQGTWQEFLDEATGQLYYYNSKTGECSWEPPSGDSPGVVESLQSAATDERAAIGVSSWVMYIDPASQAPYYVNMETLATSWEQPDSFTVAEPNATANATGNEDSYVIDDHVALEI